MKPFIPSKAAEIIFALVIGTFGVLHLKNGSAWAAGVPAYMPGGGTMWIYVTGTAMVLAALAIISGIMKTLACYLLALLLIIFIVTIHFQEAMHGTWPNLLKNTA